MSNIIEFKNVMNISDIKKSQLKNKLMPGMIVDSEISEMKEFASEHTAEPIKSIDDINKITTFLISNKRYRDNMLFILGINFGLRVSDLLSLKFSDLINQDLTFKTSFLILEKKTANTRKIKKNRHITINQAVIDAVVLFLENNPSALDDYVFASNGVYRNKPISRMQVDRILKKINEDCNIGIHMSSHTLRKTFGYHQMRMSNNSPRKLLLLQKMFGHSSTAMTMEYIGLTNDEIIESYRGLNLGSSECYNNYSKIEDEII